MTTKIDELKALMAAAGTIVHFWNNALIGDSTDCWQWVGNIHKKNGYGRYHVGKLKLQAHRVAYEILGNHIPKGLVIDHLCRNRACVNPSHMEPVTNAVNLARGFSPSAIHKRKTHCKHGHEFTSENTIVAYGKWRKCRVCQQQLGRNAWEKVKDQTNASRREKRAIARAALAPFGENDEQKD